MQIQKLQQNALKFSNSIGNINGSDIQNVILCSTRTWLTLHRIDEEAKNNLFIMDGAINHIILEKENDNKIIIEGLKPDKIDWQNHIITEYKRSDSHYEASLYQSLFYATLLQARTYKNIWRVCLKINDKESIYELNNEYINNLFIFVKEINQININKNPKPPQKISLCKGCSWKFTCFGEIL